MVMNEVLLVLKEQVWFCTFRTEGWWRERRHPLTGASIREAGLDPDPTRPGPDGEPPLCQLHKTAAATRWLYQPGLSAFIGCLVFSWDSPLVLLFLGSSQFSSYSLYSFFIILFLQICKRHPYMFLIKLSTEPFHS